MSFFPLLLHLAFFLSPDPIDAFSWLPGTWEMKKGDGALLEVWVKKSPTLLEGFGLKVEKADTTILEKLALTFDNDQFWYIPTVPDQNDAMPVPFKFISANENKYVFENPAHDFPQRIIYQLKGVNKDHSLTVAGDTLFVRVEAIDRTNGIDFYFIKKN